MKHALIFCIILNLIMAGLDKFLATSLSETIKNELDDEELKNVERKLFLEHGMSIKLSIEHFEQFMITLKSNSSIDVNQFHKICTDKVIKIKKSDSRYFVKLINDELINLILGIMGDSESRKILGILISNELTIPEILKKSKVPKTSGYRKIENLILTGVIIETGRILSESKKVSKYKCCFEEIITTLNKDSIQIECKVNKTMFEKSSCLIGLN